MLKRFLKNMKSVFSDDLGIDLGTMNTLVIQADRGIVLDEPSVIACNADTGRVIAVGKEAKRMLGRAPGNIKTYRPVRNGVISDSMVTDKMLAYFIKESRRYFKVMQPRVLIGVPYGITTVEAEAVRNSARKAGARDVRLVAEPYAAAVGAGMPVLEPTGNLVVDIGGGTTEVAMISLGCIAEAESIQVGGDKMDEAIEAYMRQKYQFVIENQGEQIKMQIGNACESDEPTALEIGGLEIGVLENSKAVYKSINSNDVQQALDPSIRSIIACVKRTIERSKSSLATDLLKNGIVLTGGGALLKGLDYRLEQETGLKVRIAKDPLKAVVNGTGELLRHADIIFSFPEERTFGCPN